MVVVVLDVIRDGLGVSVRRGTGSFCVVDLVGLDDPKRSNTRASGGNNKEAMEQRAEEDAALGWALACLGCW